MLTELALSVNAFSIDYLKLVYSSTDNVFFSSASLSTAFAMLIAGARGPTADELKQAFKINHISDVDQHYGPLMNFLIHPDAIGSYNLSMGNKMVVSDDMPILEQFKTFIAKTYKTGVDSVNFARDGAIARDSINAWVSKRTIYMIKEILDDPLTSQSKLVLLSGIYFNGTWISKFQAQDTKKETFYGVPESQVDFMFQKACLRAFFDVSKDVTVIELPYIGNTSLFIALPNENTGLESLVSSLSRGDLERYVVYMKQQYKNEVSLYMPKFRVESSYDLIPILSKMGVHRVFDELEADLSGITGSRGLFVSLALHKATFDVDEEGPKESSVVFYSGEATVSSNSDVVIQPETYRINRPFLFFIRDQITDVNLFTGTISRL
ncbi:Leukocyte elastase inhibitor [Halotydeus destructor]|nr:Leukocyte elastase inhibitor [Halotydeus destructor]